MRIGIDGNPLTIPFPCGVKHYAVQLLQSLAIIDKKNEYIIFLRQDGIDSYTPKNHNFKKVLAE